MADKKTAKARQLTKVKLWYGKWFKIDKIRKYFEVALTMFTVNTERTNAYDVNRPFGASQQVVESVTFKLPSAACCITSNEEVDEKVDVTKKSDE